MGNDNVKDYPPYLDYPKPRKPITNADRIRAMTDEELAHFFYNLDSTMIAKDLPPYIAPSKEEWLDWLKQEVTANDS